MSTQNLHFGFDADRFQNSYMEQRSCFANYLKTILAVIFCADQQGFEVCPEMFPLFLAVYLVIQYKNDAYDTYPPSLTTGN